MVAQFGTWSVNEADKTLTTHIEGALFPNGEGTDARVSVGLTGGSSETCRNAIIASVETLGP
jgi:hypothetical protein